MEDIQQFHIDEQRLMRINKGYNFGNLQQTEKKYFVRVMLETTIDLREKEEIIEVDTDLPVENGGYWHSDIEVINFLKELEEFVSLPLVKIRHFNRKNKVSTYGFSDKFRDEIIKFSDIDITIGELAEKKLKVIGIEDFKKKVKEILALQKGLDEKIQKLIDRFIQLHENIETLKECVGKERDSYYGDTIDRTLKIELTSSEYNKKLKEIEKEIRKIAGKLKIKVDRYDFKYIPIERKVGYDEWIKVNKEELKGDWDMSDEDDKEGYDSFEKYCEEMYEQNGGIIVENFDE